MTERIEKLLKTLRSHEYKKQRTTEKYSFDNELKGLNKYMCSVKRLSCMLENEKPLFIENDRIGFYRYIPQIPTYSLANGRTVEWHEGNITPDYDKAISNGFKKILENINESKKQNRTEEQLQFLEAQEFAINAVLEYCKKYREAAKENGLTELYNALEKIPYNGAETFYEALVFLKILIYTLRLSAMAHITIGRFDRYMEKYFEADLKRGVSEEELFELIEEFFVSINFDSDTYQGVQLGDNGQSLVLGGCDKNGEYKFTKLSRMCMEASIELNIIDPKINLRVDKNTPDELYILGTKLTKRGLGFPQYCNDDIVIPGLVKLGYSLEDARDYTVAACWEFIIPGKGRDIPNQKSFNVPLVIRNATMNWLEICKTFEEFQEKVIEEIRKECDKLISESNNRTDPPAPYQSIFVNDCIERAADSTEGGAIYNNYGFHGSGIACGADALSAIKKCVFEDKTISKSELLKALETNFENNEEFRSKLLACPRMGNNDDYADELGNFIMQEYSSYLNGKKNNKGGIFRAGTGTAQMYIWDAKNTKATADGRYDYEPYGASYSPSLLTKPDGPLSIIKSFTKFDLTNIINGGPMTLEIHDSTFRNEDGVTKVAMLVKAFIKNGGHQLQLNSINRDILIDANQNPEKYPNLIVRVWGWSGYWKELDNVYREHILRRVEYSI